MMLLKLFMAFPAGKLEATMIDPLELGETFALFTKLGEEQSRIIDTKVWSQEKDISEAVNILRQKLQLQTFQQDLIRMHFVIFRRLFVKVLLTGDVYLSGQIVRRLLNSRNHSSPYSMKLNICCTLLQLLVTVY